MLEQRFSSKVEIRASQGDEGSVITGYAATWGTISEPLAGFRERLAPGCFARSLQSDRDIRCNFNHSADAVLGRRKNGTLTVGEDAHGLKFRCVLPDTSVARDVYKLIQRSDLSDCSFAFQIDGDGEQWSEIDDPDNSGSRVALRTITNALLFDVAIVGAPAYKNTSVSAAPEMNSFGTEAVAKVWSEPTPRSLMDYFPEGLGLPKSFPMEVRSKIFAQRREPSSTVAARQRLLNFVIS